MQVETLTDNEVAQRIVDICKGANDGTPHQELSQLVPVPEPRLVDIINQLIRQNYIKAQQNSEGTLVYRFQDPEAAKRFLGLDRETMMIYELIAASKTSGLTKQEIKNKSGMNPGILTNILNTLKKRELIKSEKALNQKNKNVWMLYDLEPSSDVGGGIFYTKGEFDDKLVDAMYEKILKYIQKTSDQQGSVSKNQIFVFLRSSESALDLKDEDVQSIINILIYDGKIEEIGTTGGYRVCDWDESVRQSVLTEIPCGTCPVFLECREGSVISPEKCIYFLDW